MPESLVILTEAEVAGHLGGLDGLEEELALEDFRNEQGGEGEPRVRKGKEGGGEGEDDSRIKDAAKWAELESCGVAVG